MNRGGDAGLEGERASVVSRPSRADLESAGPSLTFSFEGLANEADAQAIVAAAIPQLRELFGLRDGDGSHADGESPPGDDAERNDDGLLLDPLRLIVFAADLRSAVHYWQRELGLPEELSDYDEGVAVGKSFVWGDGKPETTFAVVLFDLNIGFGLASAKPLARGLLAHELAHVHLGAILRQVLGAEVKGGVKAGDWPELRAHLAVNCFDEFYAEYVAADYLDHEGVELSTDLLVKVAAGVRERVRERVASYRHKGDHGDLWNFTITEVSSFTNQLGRVLGLLHGRELPQKLVAELDALSPRFAEHLREMRMALDAMMSLTYDALDGAAFAPAELVVEAVFTTFGVEPKWDGVRLGIDVPWWPGEEERARTERSAAVAEQARRVQAQVDDFTSTMAKALAAFRR